MDSFVSCRLVLGLEVLSVPIQICAGTAGHGHVRSQTIGQFRRNEPNENQDAESAHRLILDLVKIFALGREWC